MGLDGLGMGWSGSGLFYTGLGCAGHVLAVLDMNWVGIGWAGLVTCWPGHGLAMGWADYGLGFPWAGLAMD
jgi:hypothetical protein